MKRKETNVTEYINIVPLTWISLLGILKYFRIIYWEFISVKFSSSLQQILNYLPLGSCQCFLSLYTNLPVILSNALHVVNRNEVIPMT
jgi:hypothetical protein